MDTTSGELERQVMTTSAPRAASAGDDARRALFALRQGEIQIAATCAKQALDWLLQTQYIWRGLSATIASTEWVALGYFQQARNLKPDYANAYYNWGHALAEKGDLNGAVQQYQIVQQLVANDKTTIKLVPGPHK